MNQTTKRKKHLFLVDGYSYLFRAYHSLPPLTNPAGTPVGAVYGFTNMLLKLKNQVETANSEEIYLITVFDAGKNTFRNEIYSEYKANRPEAPEDLKPQFSIIRDAAEALNIRTVEKIGFEADDIIATYADIAKKEGFYTTIVSGDKDLMQLVDDEYAEMYDSMRHKHIKEEQVKEKFGVEPDKVLDILSLMGDSSDNIPGVPGIGPKTAAELVNTYGSLDGVYEHVEEIKQNKRRESLIENKDNAYLSKELAALKYDVDVPSDLEEFKVKGQDNEKLIPFLKEHGFKTMLAKFGNKLDEIQSPENTKSSEDASNKVKVIKNLSSKVIESEEKLNNYFQNKEIREISLYYLEQEEANFINFSINGEESILYQISALEEQGETASIQSNNNDLFAPAEEKEPPSKASKNLLPEILENIINDSSVNKVFYGYKEILKTLPSLQVKDFSYDDVKIMHYVLKGTTEKNEIAILASEYLGISELDEKTIPAITLNLHKNFEQGIYDQKLSYVYKKIDLPSTPILFEVEQNGIVTDPKVLNDLQDEFGARMEILKTDIHKIAGEEFNIGSPKQLGEILFEKLSIEGGKKTKSGQYKTDSETLEKLSMKGFEIADKLIEWRGLDKLTGTYTKALIKEISKEDGRIHTTFNNTSTTTGRLSSSNPNLQNIPIRTEDGRKIRDAFVAQDGYLLIDADYSQIELRLLAHMADIPTLKEAFKKGQDIHSATAAQVFGVNLEDVTADLRRKAKTVNFGIIYGQSAFGLAKQLDIGRVEAKEIIEKYFEQYPGIRKYMDNTIEDARRDGYVSTILGRKIFLPNINNKNGMLRQFAERAAINAPLQGTAADIIKLAMINVDKYLKESKVDAKLLLQIHDELILEAKEDIAEKILPNIRNKMEEVISLSIPLIADANTGKNWGVAH